MLVAMRLALLLALAFAAAPAAAAPDGPENPAYKELPPGRYSIAVTGLVSTVCARAVAAEWRLLPEVEKAEVDFDSERALVTVRLDRALRVASLRRALRRAEKLSRLGARYDLKDILYKP
jgi:hypothetical protein